MGKLILFMAVVGAIGYGAWTRFADRAPESPVYAEVRVKHAESGAELVGIGKMNSEDDCQRRSEIFWGKIFTAQQQFELASASCSNEISERHAALFANRTIHATYLALDRGNSGERDGRFVIFGVPSSEAARVCPNIINKIKQRYSGNVRCIAGTIG